MNLQTLDADFAEFRAILSDFLAAVPDSAWSLRTGSREKDWTLHETVAHLVALADAFNIAAEYARDQKVLTVEGLATRRDISGWNLVELRRRMHFSPAELTEKVLAALDRGLEIAHSMNEAQSQQTIFLRGYNRPSRAVEMIEFHLSHMGVIHAAQIVRPLNQDPLWTRYSAAFTHRLIDRFFRHISYAYWQEHGGDLNGAIHFHIGGESGGLWHLIAAPDGGSAASGEAPDVETLFTLHCADAAALFGIFTMHLPLLQALQESLIRLEGDPQLAMRTLRLFSATAPG